jgi:hypothetical protein
MGVEEQTELQEMATAENFHRGLSSLWKRFNLLRLEIETLFYFNLDGGGRTSQSWKRRLLTDRSILSMDS